MNKLELMLAQLNEVEEEIAELQSQMDPLIDYKTGLLRRIDEEHWEQIIAENKDVG